MFMCPFDIFLNVYAGICTIGMINEYDFHCFRAPVRNLYFLSFRSGLIFGLIC